MIEIRELTKRYGKVTAVDCLNLKVGRGELFGFIGPNGAGKTTTIQVLATLLEPTLGAAYVNGLDVRLHGRKVRGRIGYMPDFFGVYENLRVSEYLEFFAAAYDVPPYRRKALLGQVLELTDLTGKRDAMVGALSRGMQQRLGLARVLIHDPDLLLLDEPASGLDPRARVEVREILKELREMGKTIVLSSHILADVAEVCTSIGIIEKGRLVTSGPLTEVLARAGVANAVMVRLDGPPDGAPEALRALPGVQKVEVTDDDAIRVLLGPNGTGAPEVAALLVEKGYRVQRLGTERVGLEEAYFRLTKGIVS